jgi:hypothetical protein
VHIGCSHFNNFAADNGVTAEHLAKTIGNRPCNLPTQRKFFVISQSGRTRLE